MGDRHHGHPLGATLIIGAIFSVALAFYLATPPAMLRSTSAAQVSLLAAPIQAQPPAMVPRGAVMRAASRLPEPVARVEEEMAQVDVTPESVAAPLAAPEPELRAFAWSTAPATYPPALSPVSTSTSLHGAAPSGSATNGGAVTHAFATAGSAIRSAFKKAF